MLYPAEFEGGDLSLVPLPYKLWLEDKFDWELLELYSLTLIPKRDGYIIY